MNLKPFLLLVPHMTAIASDKNHEIENLIRAEGAYHTLTVFLSLLTSNLLFKWHFIILVTNALLGYCHEKMSTSGLGLHSGYCRSEYH